jgi:hypothetical protein
MDVTDFHSFFAPEQTTTTTYQLPVHGDLFGAFSEVVGDHDVAFVFTTGPLRFSFHRSGGNKSATHHTADATLAELAVQKRCTILLKYLTNADEAKYGFETLLENSRDVLDDAISKSGITARLVIVVTSGTTSFQAGVYNRDDGTITRMDSFDYGTNNRNPEGFEAYRAWLAAQEDVRDVVSIGSESYAAPAGKIATNQSLDGTTTHEFLSGLDTTARAYAAVQAVFDMATSVNKAYYAPHRKTWNAKTSATLALRKLYPTGALLDWGGGQIKDEENDKKVNFDQRMLIGAE